MGTVYVRGDTHGQFSEIKYFCESHKTTLDDVLVILGDVGINIYGSPTDDHNKRYLSKLPITLFCIRGNHEMRPSDFDYYEKIFVPRFNCFCWWDKNYPNIYFPEDGVCYLNGKRCLVCGGAYSIDKDYRLLFDLFWNPTEQMNEEERDSILKLVQMSPQFDYVFSHTAPLRYEPTWLFMNGIDQSKVDKTMEKFLDDVYSKIDLSTLKNWFFGHYHADYQITDKVWLLYRLTLELK